MAAHNVLTEERLSNCKTHAQAQEQAVGPKEVTESEVIRRAKHKDAMAFETLYKLHSRRIYALCFRMLGNMGDAEDLTQEAFLRAFRKIHTFRGESAFSTWLYRLAVNAVLMRLRRKKLPETSSDAPQPQMAPGREMQKETGSQDLSLTGTIDRVCLEQAISQLPPSHKIVFELHDVRGYKHKEIAKIMDFSVGTSKAQLHRARRRLRELLQVKLSVGSFSLREAPNCG